MNEFETSLNSLLADTFNYILRFEESSLKGISNMSVTVAEAHALEAIGRQNDNITVSEIAAALDIAVPTATVAVRRLEEKHYIVKTACPKDARRSMLSLTEQGKKVNRAHELFHRRMVRNVSREFTDAEREVLLRAIQKLSGFFKEKVEA